jgi:hypothetical protein
MESKEPRDRRQSDRPVRLVAIVVALIVAYGGAYLMTKRESSYGEGRFWVSYSSHEQWDDRMSRFFWPIHILDRAIRPDRYASLKEVAAWDAIDKADRSSIP